MSGGGSGSAGGGSASEYPTYMQDRHGSWLFVVEAMMDDARAGGSPFLAIDPYNPVTEVTNMNTAVQEYQAIVSAMSYCDDWQAMMDCAKTKIDGDIVDEATADANIDAFGNLIDDQITSEVIPRFEAGMADINSVISSAFVIGRALIEDGRDKAVIKYGTDLKLQNYKQRNEMIMTSAESMKALHLQYIENYRVYVALIVEVGRITIVANVEYQNQTADFADRDARWDLEVFQYGSNVMASVSGGTVAPGKASPNQGMSALGGALSGAASGAMIGGSMGGPKGAVAGAIIGGAVGYFGSK